jgi:branched-chain amino acid transport system substrate-binding protein
MSPIEDSPAIDSRSSRDLGVVPALCDEALDGLDFLGRMQGRHLRPCQEPYKEVLTVTVSSGFRTDDIEESGRTRTIRRVALIGSLVIVLTACEAQAPDAAPSPRTASAPTAEPIALKVAFIQDLAPEGSLDRTLPAFQGAELAFTVASAREGTAFTIGIVAFDIDGSIETGREIAEEIAGDPSYVAAIAAPGLPEQQAIADGLDGMPFLSLSDRGAMLGEDRVWLRLVAPLRDLATRLGRLAESHRSSRRGVCLAEADELDQLARYTRGSLSSDVDVTSPKGADDVTSARCGVVVWSGDGLGAAAIAVGRDADVRLIGGPGLRDDEFIEDAGASAEGALSVCSCADVSNSLDLAARRFIQTFQSENGTAPGPYAVEAWDAARMIIVGIDAAGPSRGELASWFSGVTRFDGLAGSYSWTDGELASPSTFIRTYEVVGGRWVLVELP